MAPWWLKSRSVSESVTPVPCPCPCMILKEVFPVLWGLREGFLEAGNPEMNPEGKTVVGQAEDEAGSTDGPVESRQE